MIAIVLSRILTFLSNMAINKGNKLLFHRYDMLSLVLFFVAVIFWLDPNLRQYFNLLQVNLKWYKTLGVGIASLPIILTLFHVVLDWKKKGSFWYFGDGHGNLFEDIVRIAAGTDYRSNKNRYIITSIVIRGVMLAAGLTLCFFTP